jgi:hypothetical protein
VKQLRFIFVALALPACVVAPRVSRDENVERIDVGMRREQYSDSTPGAAGITLGPESEPLAAPFPERAPIVVSPLAVVEPVPGRRTSPYGQVVFLPVPMLTPGCKPPEVKVIVKQPGLLP